MDLSALERRVSALEISLDFLESWITISTFLVVIGLIVEYWHPFCDLMEAIRKRPPFPWKKLLEITGGILVTIGVAGELWFQSRASDKQVLIRSATHEIEGLLNKEAGDARKEAGKANERAANAEERAATLLAEIQPRSLSLSQQRDIANAMRAFSGRKVMVLSNRGDLEGYQLGKQILASLQSAHLDVENHLNNAGGGGTYAGVSIGHSRSNREAANALKKALGSILGNVLAFESHGTGGGNAVIGPVKGSYDPLEVPQFVVSVAAKPLPMLK